MLSQKIGKQNNLKVLEVIYRTLTDVGMNGVLNDSKELTM
jgi:hypothetical protein